MALLHRWTPSGFRVHLIPWLDFFIEWACGLVSGIQLAWSNAPDRRRGISRRRCTGDG